MQQTHHERQASVCIVCDTAVPVCISNWVSVRVCEHFRVCVCVCDGLPEGSLCAGVSLERQMNGADILGRPGSGQSFIWAETILALRFGALTQEQCQPLLLLFLLPALFSSMPFSLWQFLLFPPTYFFFSRFLSLAGYWVVDFKKRYFFIQLISD